MEFSTKNIFEKRVQLRELLIQHFGRNVDICHERAIKPIFRDMVLRDAIYAW